MEWERLMDSIINLWSINARQIVQPADKAHRHPNLFKLLDRRSLLEAAGFYTA
jgi:hypothetical protein